MKKVLLSFVLVLFATVIWAHDFSADNADGKTIYYVITNIQSKTVSVSYWEDDENYLTESYYGNINIPSYVIYKGLHYSVTGIEEKAFYKDSRITSIFIPSSIKNIGLSNYLSTDGCSSLASINVSEDNPNYSSVDGVLFNKDRTTLIKYPNGKSDTHYTVPNSVTLIGTLAFSGCNFITSVTISNSVTMINPGNFLDDCSRLSSINVLEDNPSYSSLDGVLLNKDMTSIEIYPNGRSDTHYTIPSTVTSISTAFNNCERLTSLTIPNSVTSIGRSAFYGCM